jgi:hypothetical protein
MQPRFSPQEQKDVDTSEAEKGADAQAIKDQLKASQIMAEHLPGLIDPNLPPDQQPLHDTSNPNPVTAPPQPLRPDRFSPGAEGVPASPATGAHDSNTAAPDPSTPGQNKSNQQKTPQPGAVPARPVAPASAAKPSPQGNR